MVVLDLMIIDVIINNRVDCSKWCNKKWRRMKD